MSIDCQPPDLTDPAVLDAQCAELAQGLDQQAQASRGGTALSGSPYPEQFYMRCAAVFRACAEFARKHPRAAAEPAAPPVDTKPPVDLKKK